jgi:hypothetical protein
MATLVLQTVGSVVGGFLGGPIGAAIGGVIGGSVGSVVDQSLVSGAAGGGGRGRKISVGPRLKDLDGISATEGAPIPRLYGRARLGGQVIWATRLEEEAVYSATRARGGKSVGSKPKPSIDVSYRYSVNVAIGLCEGPIAFVRRVWADGKLIDLTTVTMRVHQGHETQAADPLILARQGAAGAPAYRGLAYVVFERLPLEAYGNRLPQFTFEVVRPVHGLCRRVRAVNLIPGAGEYVYEPLGVAKSGKLGISSLPNRTQLTHTTDWHASIDALQSLCPNLEHVALVVSWFGDDLRAGHCTIRPLAEPGSIDGNPYSWSVAGLTRATAGVVSAPGGNASFGGTPSDGSVMRAIRDLKQRGLNVTLYPFVMMDVPPGNTRPDPWTGAAAQPAYPWRGRITCDPALGRLGTADGTASAMAQINLFFGTCLASQFSVSTDSVVYSGPAEWTLRRLVLHVAALGKAAGGVDAIVIGSEFISLTTVRGTGAINPAVQGLKTLAAQVRALCGSGVKITYGADWTEYGAETRLGGQDVGFPLDPLWSDANIDAVAIDWYPPITDWRDGIDHADAQVFDGPYDRAMFAARIAGGEAYDWYYANDADRAAQVRSPITDGAANKPWVFRKKDLVSWWSNPHFARNSGVEQALPTAWTPGSKPIWLLELGCPAVDRGANGPNVFPDPKSSENALPAFSRGMRDDLVQARALEGSLDRFDPSAPGFLAAANPEATLYAGRMVDPSRVYLWCWDARPFPAFPLHADRWADVANHETGHWLNGRLEGAPIDDLLKAIVGEFDAAPTLTCSAEGFIDGYVIDRPMSARSAIEPLADVFAFDSIVSLDQPQFRRRPSRHAAVLDVDALAVDDRIDRPLKTRAQDSELPGAVTLAFIDPDPEYRQGSVRAAVANSGSSREATLEIAAAMSRQQALHRAQVMLTEIRAARDAIEFLLPPSRLEVEPGDAVLLEGRTYRINRITNGRHRVVEAVSGVPTVNLGAPQRSPGFTMPAPRLAGQPLVVVLDLPVAEDGVPVLQHLAVVADPWPGGLTLWRSEDGTSFEPVQGISRKATIGETKTTLAPGPLWRFDRKSSVDLEISSGTLQSVPSQRVLNGANLVAIEASGGWEILSYTTATLLAPNWWRLSGLLRGLAGSEPFAAHTKPAGSRTVILDGGVLPLASGLDWLNRMATYRLSADGRDHGDPMAVSFNATAGSVALKPLAPVRLRAKRELAGVRLSWIRRTRYGGDNWELTEVPLNEDSETYRIEIWDGSAVKRTLDAQTTSVLYTTGQENADFGSAQGSLFLCIRQISVAAGLGNAAEQIVPVV